MVQEKEPKRNGQSPNPLYREYLVLHFIAKLGISPKPLGYSTENLDIDELLMEQIGGVRFGSKKFSLVHFDISDGNTIISRKGPVFLDWESAYLNDPARDVSRAIVNLTGGSERLAFTFLKSYGANDEMLRRVFAYLLLAYLSIAVGRSGKKEDLPKRASLRSLNRGDLFKLAMLQFRKITNI
ncbi:phosphotransferase [Candidatus Shapirobacteria bacterium]|nr:phosphotransferase [Candidatus Shapirobacteria bacterium]